MEGRRRRLLDAAREAGYDSLVAFTPENLYYTTGFWGEAASVLDESGVLIVAPGLEAGRAATESVGCSVAEAGRDLGLVSGVAKAVRAGSRPCTDCRDYSMMRLLKKEIPAIEHDPKPFHDARMIKDEDEIRTLSRASSIIDGLFETCIRSISPGMTELELQSTIMAEAVRLNMFDTGYPSTLNPLIVAGGPNGALPHAQPTPRKFRRGDLVVVDITLRHDGYVSDATRTFGIGGISDSARDVYDAVRQSQEAGLRAATPGRPCGDVDAACRNSINETGHGEHFIHATGHGIGLEVHERPTVSALSEYTLQDNMAITVEPGIYIPEKYGVRIEDSLIVAGRQTIMHKFTKELVLV